MSFDKETVNNVIKDLHIQPVGCGYIDLICPWENIHTFIDKMDELGIRITGFTWWCHVTDNHKACGMGGPKNRYGDGWYSEIFALGEVLCFDSNQEVREYLLVEWQKSKEYRACFVPGFWLETEE